MTHKREIQGKVVKISGDKTVSIVVERRKVGDEIIAIECRPLSKTKSFRLKTVVSGAK